jgi:hypothetical protein
MSSFDDETHGDWFDLRVNALRRLDYVYRIHPAMNAFKKDLNLPGVAATEQAIYDAARGSARAYVMAVMRRSNNVYVDAADATQQALHAMTQAIRAVPAAVWDAAAGV